MAALHKWPENGPSCYTEEIAKDFINSPHHDSQFSAFSTKVLNQVNWKHNRSSSPFTTLADRAERKVVSTGAGNPTIDQRHDSEQMHIMPKLVTPKYAVELFGLVGNFNMLPYQAPDG